MEENETYEGFEKINKTRKWKFIIISILVLIAIGIGLFVGYTKLTQDPLIVYKMAINNMHDYLAERLSDDNKLDKFKIDGETEPFTVELDAKLNSNVEEIKPLTGINYNLRLGIDYPKKQGSVSLGLGDGNKDIVRVLAALMNKNVYVSSKEIYDKVVKIGEIDLDSFLEENFVSGITVNDKEVDFSSVDAKQVKAALKEFKNILIKSLQKDNLKISDATINNKKLKKATYTLDKNDLETSLKYILTEVSNSSEILDVMASISMKGKNDLREILDNLSKNMDLDLDKLEINIYVDAWNKVKEADLFVDGDKYLVYTKEDDGYKVSFIYQNDEIIFQGQENELIIKALESGSELFSLIVKEDEDGFTIALEGIETETQEKVYLKLEMANLEVTENKMAMNFGVTLNVGSDSLSLSGKSTISKGEIEVINATDAIYYEDISQTDMTKIMENLQNLIEEFNISDMFSQVL